MSEKHHLNTSAPTTPALSLPPAPSWLGGEAQKLSRGRTHSRVPPCGQAEDGWQLERQQHLEKTLFDTYKRGFFGLGLGFFLLCFAWAGRELISSTEPPFPSRASSLPNPQPPADLPAEPAGPGAPSPNKGLSAPRPRRGAPGSLLQITSL